MYHWPRIFDKKTCFVFGSLSFALYVFVLDLFIYLFSSIISFGRYIYGSLIVQSSNLLPIHLILLAGHRFSVKIYVWSNTHNDSEYWLFFLSATKNSFCFFFFERRSQAIANLSNVSYTNMFVFATFRNDNRCSTDN